MRDLIDYTTEIQSQRNSKRIKPPSGEADGPLNYCLNPQSQQLIGMVQFTYINIP